MDSYNTREELLKERGARTLKQAVPVDDNGRVRAGRQLRRWAWMHIGAMALICKRRGSDGAVLKELFDGKELPAAATHHHTGDAWRRQALHIRDALLNGSVVALCPD